MTDLIYYRQPLQMEAEARLSELEPAEGGAFWARLDRTVIYPGGGGQPADLARIGEVAVTEISVEDKHNPRYLLAAGAEALELGGTVRVSVEREHRTDYMEQHSGQHLLSAALKRTLDLNTVAVHQGADLTTIELDRDAPADELAEAVAEAAAAVIAENRPITMREVDEGELASLPLRRPTKRTGRIRIVEIGNYDCAACGGVHLPSTGLIGAIALATTERIRGRTRSAWYIGRRAREEFRRRISEGQQLSDLLSAAPGLQAAGVEQLLQSVKDRETEIRRLQATIAEFRARELSGRTGALVAAFPAAAAELRATAEVWLASAIGMDAPAALFLIGSTDEAGRHPILLAIPEPHGSRLAPRITDEVLQPLGVRGGGRPPFWQGVVEGTLDAGTAESQLQGFLGGFHLSR